MGIKQFFRSHLLTKALVLSSFVSTGLIVPRVAEASFWSNSEVAAQLWGIAATLNLGNVRLSDLTIEDLYSNRTHDISLTLSAGRTHYLIGVCDSDCYDMDFVLYDGNGNRVARDVAYDAFPTVRISPRQTGRYTLRVSMPDCSTNYCSYGVGLFN